MRLCRVKRGFCLQEDFLHSLLSAAKLTLISGTLDLHTNEARRRRWCHAELVDFDSASALHSMKTSNAHCALAMIAHCALVT